MAGVKAKSSMLSRIMRQQCLKVLRRGVFPRGPSWRRWSSLRWISKRGINSAEPGSDRAAGQRGDPDWREEYPLQIDDLAAVQLLTSMVKVASQASTEQGAVAVFQVVRSLSYLTWESGGSSLVWSIPSRLCGCAGAAVRAGTASARSSLLPS